MSKITDRIVNGRELENSPFLTWFVTERNKFFV